MPLPNADPDKRMYKLLKNIDLENLSFAQFQSTAQTVFAEPEAEDTLRRIVLINLARMSVAGDWNGLTTTSVSVEGIGSVIPQANIGTSYTRHMVTHYPVTGNQASGTSTIAQTNLPNSRPFIAPQTGDIDEIGVVVSGAAVNTMRIGIFSDSDMAPHVLLGYADIDTSSAASVYQTSWSSTVATTRGTVYHCMWVRTESGTNPSLTSESNSGMPWVAASSIVSASLNAQSCLALSGSDNDLEATVTKTNLTPTYNGPLRITLKYA